MHDPSFAPLPYGEFGILLADPPWDYAGQAQHEGAGKPNTGGAVRHYPTLPLRRLKDLGVGECAADDALLFMWATSPMLDQAISLGKAWGFAYTTIGFVWDKVRVNPGYYTMSQCEVCLIFKRGRIPRPRGLRNVRQLVVAARGRHSAKPEQVRVRIERMFPQQSKLELFARRPTRGWTTWGLEAEDGRELDL